MTVQEGELIAGKWYVVVADEQGQYQAISPAFDTYYEACHYPKNAKIKQWTEHGWSTNIARWEKGAR